MIKRLSVLVLMVIIVTELIEHKPHVHFNPLESKGLYDINLAGIITFENPPDINKDILPKDDNNLVGKVLKVHDTIEEQGGVTGYITNSATQRIQKTLDMAMDVYSETVESAATEIIEGTI